MKTKLKSVMRLTSTLMITLSIHSANSMDQSIDPFMSSWKESSLFSSIPLIDTSKMPSPPGIIENVSKTQIQFMLKNKSEVNTVLDWYYWGLCDNVFAFHEINENELIIQEILHKSPDHRLWKLIYSVNAFESLPEVLVSIIEYAKNDLPTAQHILGQMYLTGKGLPKDIDKGLHCIQLASSRGFAWSQYVMGNIYYEGRFGLDKNISKATELYQLAADQGFILAQLKLAKCYLEDDRSSVSKAKAQRIYNSIPTGFDNDDMITLEKYLGTKSWIKTEDTSYKVVRPFEEGSKTENKQLCMGRLKDQDAMTLVKDMEALHEFENQEITAFEVALSNQRQVITEATKVLTPLQKKYLAEIDLSHLENDDQVMNSELNTFIYDELTERIIPLLKKLNVEIPNFKLENQGAILSRSVKDGTLSINESMHALLKDEDVEITFKFLDVCNSLHNIIKKINEIDLSKFKGTQFNFDANNKDKEKDRGSIQHLEYLKKDREEFRKLEEFFLDYAGVKLHGDLS